MAGIHPASDGGLMDEYVQALRHDPDAPPPPGLDAQTAAFVRRLVQAKSAPARLEPDQQARIWYKALKLAQTTQPRPEPNRIVRHVTTPGDQSMLVSSPVRPRPAAPLKMPGLLLPFAAALLVVLLAAVISRFSPSGQNPGGGNIPPLGAGDDQAQRVTATPTMTATPFLVTPPAPIVTATLVAPFDMATPTPLSPADMVAPSPFPPTVVPPVITSTPIMVPPASAERAIRMNSTTRDELSPERSLVTYRLPVEVDGWVAVAVRPDDPSLDLALSYEFAQPAPEAGAPSGGGGGGGSGGGSLPLDEIGLFSFARSGSILSLTVGANNINVMGRSYFTLNIYQQSLVPASVAQPVQAALNPGQQAAMFLIESSGNQLVDLNVESDGRADLYMNIVEIAGDVEVAGHIYRGPITGCIQGQPLFCMDQDGGVRRDPELTDVTLLEGARYAVFVRAREVNAETEFTFKVSPR